MIKLYIIRHGETAGNKKALLLGRGTDSPLNEKGREQAQNAAEQFRSAGIRFDRVFSSPLIRAVETARIVSGQEPETDDRLIEMERGPYEGADLKKIPPELAYFFSDFVRHPAPEGMESLESICARAKDLLAELKVLEELQGPEKLKGLEELQRPEKQKRLEELQGLEKLKAINTAGRAERPEDAGSPGGSCSILLSTHAIAMKGFLETLTPESGGAYWSKYIGNCEVYVTELMDGKYTVPEPFFTAE